MSQYYNRDQNFYEALGKKAVAPAVQTPTPVQKPQPVQSRPNQIPAMSAKNQVAPKPMPVQAPQISVPSPQKPNTFFKGGFISKAIDTVSTPYYALSGFLKGSEEESKRQRQEVKVQGDKNGKSPFLPRPLDVVKEGAKNIIPGIQQRTGFTDAPGDYNIAGESGVKNKTAQNIINFGAAVAAPSLAISKIPGARQVSKLFQKGGNVIKNATQKIPGASKVIESTIDPYFRNKQAGKLIVEANRSQQTRISALYNELNDLRKGLSNEQQRIIGRVLDTGEAVADKKLMAIADKARQITTRVGQEAVDSKLMKQETLDRMGSQYLSRVWDTAGKKGMFQTKNTIAPKFTGTMFKQRKGKEGYIEEFAPALLKGLGKELKDITAKNLYDDLAKNFGKKVKKNDVMPEGFSFAREAIQNTQMKRFFKSVALPNEVIDYLNRLDKTANPNVFDNALNIWKAIKTVYNPAYHGRNVISNQFLSNMATGQGIPKTVANYIRSVGNYAGKGDQRYLRAATQNGLIKNVSLFSGFDDLMKNSGLRSQAKWRTVLNSPRKVQQFTEDTTKLNVFRVFINREARKVGMSIDDALRDKRILKYAIDKTEEAIFSPFRINAQERQMISRFIPFYSFTRQAVPFTAKTFARNPKSITNVQRTREAVENLSRDDAPDPTKTPSGSFENLVRLPMKDSAGRNNYIDPTYTLPYGNFDTSQEGQLPFGFSTNPFFAELYSQLLNKDTFTQRPITKYENVNQGSDRLKHLFRTLSPTFVTNVMNKLVPAFQGKEDASGNTRGRGQAVVDTITGIKTRNYSNAELENQANIEQSIDINSFENDMEKVDREEGKGNINAEEAQFLRDKLKQKFDNYVKGIR